MKTSMAILSGNANLPLAKKISRYLGRPLAAAVVDNFADGEVKVALQDDVRGLDVFVIQPTCKPVNQHLMELLIIIDALRRASAERITAGIPYYGYARQDRKHEGRVPITAKLVANLLAKAGADRILTMDLHASQIQGFFDIPCDHLMAVVKFTEMLERMGIEDAVVTSPDIGSIKIATEFGSRLGIPLAVIDKRRTSDGTVEMPHLIGDVDGKCVLLVDDMISTGGTLVTAAKILKEAGADRIFAIVTHAVFAGEAVEKVNKAPLDRIFVTDTIPLGEKAKRIKNLKVISVSQFLGEAIRRIHSNESVSWLFRNNP